MLFLPPCVTGSLPMFRCSGPQSIGRRSDFNLVNERLNAGHFAWTTASDKFLEALVSKIRPVAIERGA